jgi:hypothetical protein
VIGLGAYIRLTMNKPILEVDIPWGRIRTLVLKNGGLNGKDAILKTRRIIKQDLIKTHGLNPRLSYTMRISTSDWTNVRHRLFMRRPR